MLLVDDLLALPFQGLLGIFQKIAEMADRELTDEGSLQEKLMEIQLRYEMDEVGPGDYTRLAEELEARLNAARDAVGEEEPPEEEPAWQLRRAA
jgi:hypothetical protein